MYALLTYCLQSYKQVFCTLHMLIFVKKKSHQMVTVGIHQAEQLVSQVPRAEAKPAHLGFSMPGEVEIVGLTGY